MSLAQKSQTAEDISCSPDLACAKGDTAELTGNFVISPFSYVDALIWEAVSAPAMTLVVFKFSIKDPSVLILGFTAPVQMTAL